jgi:hypothetical protein
MSDLSEYLVELAGSMLPTLAGMAIGQLILIFLLGLVVVLMINALFLRLALWIRKIPTTFARTLGTAFYMMLSGLCSLIPLLGLFIMFFVQLYIIHKRHFVEYVNAFIIWLIAFLLPYGIILIILALSGVIVILV